MRTTAGRTDAVRAARRARRLRRRELRSGFDGRPLRDPGRRVAGVRPGDPQPAAGDVQAARCADRPLHAALERDRPATAEESDLAARSRLRLASAGQGAARPSPLRPDALCVTLVGTPAWANGGRTPNFAPPRPRDFRRFATAAARRYPWVRYWLIWNEPNKRLWLRPTRAAIYVRHLLNPGYEAIHAVLPHARVGGGVTGPRGAAGGVAPVTWVRGMAAARTRSSTPTPTTRTPRRRPRRRPAAAARTARRSRWRRSRSSSSSSSAPSGRSRSG